ncbi:protein spinster isoform X2 [Bactrocera neohumeralis]|uniref:protein spinster isoform X2 n=1 Tax=Bactrocera neohumeralis TaxID=98809 RepID=UPI00216639E4|nr:protein spinster isoform X2 [Bactrocera neohumeralis]
MSSQSSARYLPITKMDNPALSGSSGDVEADSNSVEASLPATCSSQQLMPPNSDTDSVVVQPPTTGITRTQWFTVVVLCFVNLINYMDRFTIAGVLTDIQADFKIGDDDGGLLQTAFVLSYMVCAPLFGYLGDRYSRRWIMAIGVLLWSTTTLLGSFMGGFGGFITFRALVGIGEASYSTIAPTIISDLFIHDLRSKMLALFYFAIPVGSGFGYIVGSETARLANNWRWALRVTPILGIVAVVLIILIKEPERGESEGSPHLEPTSYTEDIKDLVKNHSFMLSTAGFTCVAFVTGALAWWGPKFIYLGIKMQPGNEELSLNDVSYKFGIIAMIAGLIGVPVGSFLAQRLRPQHESCDPYICAFGLLISAPMVYLSLVTPQTTTSFCFLFVFLAQVTLNLCWSIVADILLYVVVPTRRSTAEAFQILVSHALGDAGSPYFVGLLSEGIKRHLRSTSTQTSEFSLGIPSMSLTLEDSSQNITGTLLSSNATAESSNLLTQVARVVSENVTALVANATSLLQQNATDFVSELRDEKIFEIDLEDTDINSFKALQYSLFSTSFIEVLGAVFFFLTAIYILKDKRRATRSTLGSQAAEQ